jgi:hypothetical protein
LQKQDVILGNYCIFKIYVTVDGIWIVN